MIQKKIVADRYTLENNATKLLNPGSARKGVAVNILPVSNVKLCQEETVEVDVSESKVAEISKYRKFTYYYCCMSVVPRALIRYSLVALPVFQAIDKIRFWEEPGQATADWFSRHPLSQGPRSLRWF
ncbi:19039_t:CDS:2 [Funneliformis geosporum]|nr:19039_t:CDS:2 [Funneliformis geosporum]